MVLSPPLGVIFGYAITSGIILENDSLKSSWQYSFDFQIMFNMLFGFAVCFIPGQYINLDLVIQALKKAKKRKQNQFPDAEIGGTGQQFLGT
jgi:hypothetical protein